MHGFGRSHDKRQGRVASISKRRPSMRLPEIGVGAGTRAGSRHCSPAFLNKCGYSGSRCSLPSLSGVRFWRPARDCTHRCCWSCLWLLEHCIGSASELSRGGGANFSSSDEGDEPDIAEAVSIPASLRSARSAPRPTPPMKTSNIRKRVTPLMQKRVAARYGFKCAICGLPFTDSSLWEVNHIVPLSTARAAADVARLNDISDLQPVHRSCHQMKTSREAAAR